MTKLPRILTFARPAGLPGAPLAALLLALSCLPVGCEPPAEGPKSVAAWIAGMVEPGQAEHETTTGYDGANWRTADANAPLDANRPAGRGLSETELAIWNHPAFQREFTESYLAETEIEPSVNADERELMQKVLALISSDKLDDAARLLEKRQGPAGSGVTDFTLGNIYFQQDHLDRALASYEWAIKKHPKFRRAWRNLALIHARRGEFDKAIDEFTQVIKLGGGDATVYGLLGVAYSKVDNHLASESAYRMAILLDPGTFDWKMGLAESFFKQHRFHEAVALTDRLIADDPNRAELWRLQAGAYIGLDKPMKAAENYELIDRLGASTPRGLATLGDIYVNEELYELGVNSYLRAMDKDPQASPNRFLRAAKVLAARGALDETRRLAERIEKLYGARLTVADRKALLKLQARLAVADGADDAEARVLEEIVALDPTDGEALLLLGRHAMRNKDPEKAIFWYERAEKIEAFEADALIRHAQVLVGRSKYAEALPLLRRAQQLKPREDVQDYLEQVERVAKAR